MSPITCNFISMNSPIWTKVWEVLRDSSSWVLTFYFSWMIWIYLKEFEWNGQILLSFQMFRFSLAKEITLFQGPEPSQDKFKTLRSIYKMDIKRPSGTFMTFHTMHDQWMNYPQITDVCGIFYWQELGEGLWIGFQSWSQSSGSLNALKKYLLNTYHVLSMPVGADNSSVKKQNSYPKFLLWWKRKTMHKYAK